MKKTDKKTGIGFELSKPRPMPARSGYDIFLYPFVCLLVIGIIRMLTVPLGFAINSVVVVVCTTLMTACFFVMFKRPIRWYWLILGFHFLFGWGLWEFREQLYEGAQLYIYRVSDLAASYYVRNEYYSELNKVLPALLLIYMVIWFSFWISLGVLRLRKPIPVLIPGGLIFVGLLAVGVIADGTEFMCVLIGGVGITALLWNQSKANVTVMVSILLIAALMLQTIITALIPVPGAAERQTTRKQIETLFNEYSLLPGGKSGGNGSGGLGSSGLSGGDLSGIGDIQYFGVKKMNVTVTAKPDVAIYLKGYSGDEYVDYQWLSTENHMDDIDMSNIPYYILSQEYTESEMIIEVLNSFGAFTLVPYSAYLDENNNYGDGGREYQYYNEIYSMGTEVKNIPIPLDLYGIMELESEYTDYLYEMELNVPYNLTRLYSDSSLIMEEPVNDYSEVVQFVQQELAERAIYTLRPGVTPAGEDPIEYFLYSNQKGYCMHFASAGVMMFRLNGVPARFAEGVVINPNEFYETGDGTFKASVEDYQAHAWVEIYIEQFGWIPVEVTPGYQSGANAAENETEQSDEDEDEENPEEENEEEIEQQVTEEPEVPEEKSGGSENQSILKIGLAGVGFIILTAVIIQLRRHYIRKKRYIRLRDEDSNHAVINVFHYVKEMLTFGGMSEQQFYQSAEYKWLWDLAYQAAYSCEAVSGDEWLKCYRFCYQVRTEVYEKQPWYKRLVFNYVKCF
ncbi:MAG: transglutaminase-like domain-containing protein [Lachnospiraceae bacterium]